MATRRKAARRPSGTGAARPKRTPKRAPAPRGPARAAVKKTRKPRRKGLAITIEGKAASVVVEGWAWHGSVAEFERALRRSGMRLRLEGECGVSDIPPITDEIAQKMEEDPTPVWERSDPKLRPAAEALVKLVRKEPKGSASITSALRPQAYQDHLHAVWTRARELQDNTQPACAKLRRVVDAEMNKHDLSTERPVAKRSTHSLGRAADISWRLPEATDPNARMGQLARQAGLVHPLPTKDPPHFELPAP